MVEGINLQVNINTALDVSKIAGELQAATSAQQMKTDKSLREESMRKAEQVNTTDDSTKLDADGGGRGGGGHYTDRDADDKNKAREEAKPKDPYRGNMLDITR